MNTTDQVEAERLAKEYALNLTKDRKLFDDNDEFMAIVAFTVGYTAALEKCRGENLTLLEVAGNEHISRTIAQHKIAALEKRLVVAREALEEIHRLAMEGTNVTSIRVTQLIRKALEEMNGTKS